MRQAHVHSLPAEVESHSVLQADQRYLDQLRSASDDGQREAKYCVCVCVLGSSHAQQECLALEDGCCGHAQQERFPLTGVGEKSEPASGGAEEEPSASEEEEPLNIFLFFFVF